MASPTCGAPLLRWLHRLRAAQASVSLSLLVFPAGSLGLLTWRLRLQADSGNWPDTKVAQGPFHHTLS